MFRDEKFHKTYLITCQILQNTIQFTVDIFKIVCLYRENKIWAYKFQLKGDGRNTLHFFFCFLERSRVFRTLDVGRIRSKREFGIV